MKKIIFLFPLILGCNAFDNSKCTESVKDSFSKMKIYRVANVDYQFIVVDSNGNMLYIETLSPYSPRITKVEPIIQIQ